MLVVEKSIYHNIWYFPFSKQQYMPFCTDYVYRSNENHNVMTCIGNRVNAAFIPDKFDRVVIAVRIMILPPIFVKKRYGSRLSLTWHQPLEAFVWQWIVWMWVNTFKDAILHPLCGHGVWWYQLETSGEGHTQFCSSERLLLDVFLVVISPNDCQMIS